MIVLIYCSIVLPIDHPSANVSNLACWLLVNFWIFCLFGANWWRCLYCNGKARNTLAVKSERNHWGKRHQGVVRSGQIGAAEHTRANRFVHDSIWELRVNSICCLLFRWDNRTTASDKRPDGSFLCSWYLQVVYPIFVIISLFIFMDSSGV